eukprot:CAMPEP_0174935050 /NCGR_PEP_ID=MMETSP1355-20121228/51980_1 /TAXON_ID=464990 /ORGANISM="Hemiselmis tepida, Strain CCMP443" /LENGTH=87 /DNA_ID=CAMNT_0016181707 /DNA_START=57 /DNA_END=316 /DNA_ORIENTATION=+
MRNVGSENLSAFGTPLTPPSLPLSLLPLLPPPLCPSLAGSSPTPGSGWALCGPGRPGRHAATRGAPWPVSLMPLVTQGGYVGGQQLT